MTFPIQRQQDRTPPVHHLKEGSGYLLPQTSTSLAFYTQSGITTVPKEIGKTIHKVWKIDLHNSHQNENTQEGGHSRSGVLVETTDGEWFAGDSMREEWKQVNRTKSANVTSKFPVKTIPKPKVTTSINAKRKRSSNTEDINDSTQRRMRSVTPNTSRAADPIERIVHHHAGHLITTGPTGEFNLYKLLGLDSEAYDHMVDETLIALPTLEEYLRHGAQPQAHGIWSHMTGSPLKHAYSAHSLSGRHLICLQTMTELIGLDVILTAKGHETVRIAFTIPAVDSQPICASRKSLVDIILQDAHSIFSLYIGTSTRLVSLNAAALTALGSKSIVSCFKSLRTKVLQDALKVLDLVLPREIYAELKASLVERILCTFDGKERAISGWSIFVDLLRYHEAIQNKLPIIFMALHLLNEEYRLRVSNMQPSKFLVHLLHQLAASFGLSAYVDYYKDTFGSRTSIKTNAAQLEVGIMPVPNILDHFFKILTGTTTKPFPSLQAMIEAEDIPLRRDHEPEPFEVISDKLLHIWRLIVTGEAPQLLSAMAVNGITRSLLNSLQVGLQIPFYEVIRHCIQLHSTLWTTAEQALLGKSEIAVVQYGEKLRSHNVMSSLGEHRFTDSILEEVESMLSVNVTERLRIILEAGDGDEIEIRKTALLYATALRTYALTIAQGMLTVSRAQITLAKGFEVPQIEISAGFYPQFNALRKLDVASLDLLMGGSCTQWPQFHLGVSMALKLQYPASRSSQGSWFAQNIPSEGGPQHAGFVLGYGLLKHEIAHNRIAQILQSHDDQMKMAVLLGQSVAQAGSAHIGLDRAIKVCLPALYPETASEITVPCDVQCVALVSLGFLHMRYGSHKYVDMLAKEIGRDHHPSVHDTTPFNKEAYSVSAGISLGVMCLGSHKMDPQNLDRMMKYIHGGTKTPTLAEQRVISNQVKAGNINRYKGQDSIDISVTAPAAYISLALIYMKSNNIDIANRLRLPDSEITLEYSRPDNMLLRVLSRSLVMWDQIQPTDAWLQSLSPDFIATGIEQVKPEENVGRYDTIRHAFFYILAGGCAAIGIKFAGSGSRSAKQVLTVMFDFFLDNMTSVSNQYRDKVTRRALQTCLSTTTCALGQVMAGTGDLSVMRLFRALHSRLDIHTHYGDHMASHMALGLLFMGKGTWNLNTDNESIAALLIAFYPQFPATPLDNRNYIQAFRHLWYVAAEPRCLAAYEHQTMDIQPVTMEVSSVTSDGRKETILIRTPYTIPEWGSVTSIEVKSSRYLPCRVDFEVQPHLKTSLIRNNGILQVKRKTGHLAHHLDPDTSLDLSHKLFPRFIFDAERTEMLARRGLPTFHQQRNAYTSHFAQDSRIFGFARYLCLDSVDRGERTAPAKRPETPLIRENAETVLQQCLEKGHVEEAELVFSVRQLAASIRKAEAGVSRMSLIWNLRLVTAWYTMNRAWGQELVELDHVLQMATEIESLDNDV